MQEDVENKTVSLAIRGTKLTFRLIYKAWKAYRAHEEKKKIQKEQKKAEPVHGKQSVKELIGQGQGVSSVDLADEGLKDFQKVAAKYGVDFAVVKDKNESPPKYTIFFKAKDADAIDRVMTDYAARMLKKEKDGVRESILKKLAKFKDIVAKTPRKEHEKRKEHER